MDYQLKARAVSLPIAKALGTFDVRTRFDIRDLAGRVLDDTQDYGYKTAHRGNSCVHALEGPALRSERFYEELDAWAFWQRLPPE